MTNTYKTDLQLVKALKACGMKNDKFTRAERRDIIIELVKRPIFKEVSLAKGMTEAEFQKLAQSLNLI